MIQQNQRYRRFFIPCLSEPGAYITHNATLPQSDIIGGNLSDHILLVLPKTCKLSLLCKNWWSYPLTWMTDMWEAATGVFFLKPAWHAGPLRPGCNSLCE